MRRYGLDISCRVEFEEFNDAGADLYRRKVLRQMEKIKKHVKEKYGIEATFEVDAPDFLGTVQQGFADVE